MIEVFKWEWRYCKGGVWKQLFVQACYPVAVFLLYYFQKERLFHIASVVVSLPEEIYAFVGLNHNVVIGNLRFYILFGVMLFHIWIVQNACWRTLQLLQADEHTGSICSMCNQWYSRRQLGVGKLVCSLMAFLLQNALWYGIVFLVVFSGSVNGQQRVTAGGIVVMLWFRSSLVIGMLITVTFCVGVYSRQSARTGMSYVNFFVVGTLLIGNLYKIRDVLLWFLDQIETGFSNILGSLGWLERGYWLSPLSWLNPYNSVTNRIMLIQTLICICVALVSACAGLRRYERRRIV